LTTLATKDQQLFAGTLEGEQTPAGWTWVIRGAWTLDYYRALPTTLPPGSHSPEALDLSSLAALDTAGAALLGTLVGPRQLLALLDGANHPTARHLGLLRMVAEAQLAEPQPDHRRQRWLDAVEQLGILAASGWRNFLVLAGFMGQALATLAWLLPQPGRWRLTALVNQIHQTGLNAVPIVALLTFMVGAVVAFLGATVLANFGATVYTVDLVAYSFLREFGVLLTAILMAGRTASAFTAQLGAMKVNEEIDALRTLGTDPMEVLVLPRMLALLITLPLLTFVAMLSGIAGGAVVSVLSLDISLTRYLAIVQEVPVRHFLTGMAKAPVFAFVVALIGCLEGFKVAGSAQSVGEHTTSSVVQSIFAVILLDAVAALFFMEMGW